MIQRRTQSLPADTQCINFHATIIFPQLGSHITQQHRRNKKPNWFKNAQQLSTTPERWNSVPVQCWTLLRTDRNPRRQQSAFMCTVGAMWPNLDVPAAERGSALPSLTPAKCNSLLTPLYPHLPRSYLSSWWALSAGTVTFGDSTGLSGVLCPRSLLGFSCTEPELVTHSSLPRTLAVFPYKSPCYQAQLNPFHREMKQVSNPWA